MRLTEVRINLSPESNGRLKAYCALTFDDTFVIRDVKLIEGPAGLFLAMPSRKLADHCARCGEKNHLRARFCNHCGSRLDENRHSRQPSGVARPKLHADIAHPINAACRAILERQVLAAYRDEIERAKHPDYVPPALDGADFDDADPPAPLHGASPWQAAAARAH